MSNKIFWTAKRLETISRTFLTLSQAFLIAAVIGGFWGKIQAAILRIIFIVTIGLSFFVGILFADWPIKKEKEH